MSVEALDGGFEVPEHEEFKVVPEEHFFSKSFTVLKSHWPVAVISTNRYVYNFFDLRMHFTVVDSQTGNEIAHAIKNYGFSPRGLWNLSFLGWFKPHTLADFDVYDKDGEYIGCIDGKVLTMSKAAFDFQDASGNVIATAKQDRAQLSIHDSKTNAPIGFLRRHFDVGVEDSWTIELTNKMDPRIALIFAAFVVNNQSHFLKDL